MNCKIEVNMATMRKTVERMKDSVSQLKRGHMTIGECESQMDKAITNAANEINELDDRIRFIRILKRRGWRMLLNATS